MPYILRSLSVCCASYCTCLSLCTFLREYQHFDSGSNTI
nr:MAG TPA: hypothetical protein [Caudoviricetes sp.]